MVASCILGKVVGYRTHRVSSLLYPMLIVFNYCKMMHVRYSSILAHRRLQCSLLIVIMHWPLAIMKKFHQVRIKRRLQVFSFLGCNRRRESTLGTTILHHAAHPIGRTARFGAGRHVDKILSHLHTGTLDNLGDGFFGIKNDIFSSNQ